MKEVVIASANPGKVREFKEILSPLGLRVRSLEDFPDIVPPVEDGLTFRENATIKASYYSEITGEPCIADDSGLVVDALGGAPGINSSRFAGEDASDEENVNRLLEELGKVKGKRTARFVCSALFAIGEEILAGSEGVLEGEIIRKRRGTLGFGYDPVFYLKELGKTLAELSLEEKNRISHRRYAINELVKKLRDMGIIGTVN